MDIVILYRNMKFIFEVSNDSCWFDLDHMESTHLRYKMKINADRDVYAVLEYDGKEIEGYITDEEDKTPIPDNYPVEDKSYHFIRLKKPGYYL